LGAKLKLDLCENLRHKFDGIIFFVQGERGGPIIFLGLQNLIFQKNGAFSSRQISTYHSRDLIGDTAPGLRMESCRKPNPGLPRAESPIPWYGHHLQISTLRTKYLLGASEPIFHIRRCQTTELPWCEHHPIGCYVVRGRADQGRVRHGLNLPDESKCQPTGPIQYLRNNRAPPRQIQ
jgi:hypothetical protein